MRTSREERVTESRRDTRKKEKEGERRGEERATPPTLPLNGDVCVLVRENFLREA